MTVGVLLRLGSVTLIGNAGGAAVVTGFALYLAPTVLSADEYRELQRHSVPALVVFTVSALVFGGWWVFLRPFAPIALWLAEDRAPTESERKRVLRYPREWAIRVFVIWMFAAAVGRAAGLSV
jgi:hypothetical protein